ncbi:hypothetical protein M2459_001948 [Parabacteroides sp. PF5-5]|nr:hypothetical protein [Parabacteroides sp. PH5-39]MDH6316205.1 hypothetical protein [Parabacteroides sp. PF5-13]MDH6321434.1 hypothetical protein [Parabacteroides sp. PH5-13]MDH6325165.1 hypothetical protein [Parabacteroides sp. PH5-8]MDH6327396.1 hypothetical protein [Parabacteroides sp. PH5-41]MDH6335198.1 hypothetical protein [Parabacteroides sp. PF5-5]MDH6346181.1 hypothetical protein [Parabacteroides sp. PH5-46]MDH6361218.1 hypothetical protein [Parabacteroides sp. PH5-16]MDH6376810.
MNFITIADSYYNPLLNMKKRTYLKYCFLSFYTIWIVLGLNVYL